MLEEKIRMKNMEEIMDAPPLLPFIYIERSSDVFVSLNCSSDFSSFVLIGEKASYGWVEGQSVYSLAFANIHLV